MLLLIENALLTALGSVGTKALEDRNCFLENAAYNINSRVMNSPVSIVRQFINS